MAYESYIKFEGKTQGKLLGSSTRKAGDSGHGKGIKFTNFNYGVETPYDPSSGLPSGKRNNPPITITKEVGPASPQLFQACCTNEVLDSVVLQFYGSGSGRQEKVVQTIELTNAQIRKIIRVPSSLGKRCEAVTLTYEKLTVNGMENGIIPRSLLG